MRGQTQSECNERSHLQRVQLKDQIQGEYVCIINCTMRNQIQNEYYCTMRGQNLQSIHIILIYMTFVVDWALKNNYL